MCDLILCVCVCLHLLTYWPAFDWLTIILFDLINFWILNTCQYLPLIDIFFSFTVHGCSFNRMSFCISLSFASGSGYGLHRICCVISYFIYTVVRVQSLISKHIHICCGTLELGQHFCIGCLSFFLNCKLLIQHRLLFLLFRFNLKSFFSFPTFTSGTWFCFRFSFLSFILVDHCRIGICLIWMA